MLTDTAKNTQDFEVISTYSRAQAITDGYLVDLSDNEVAQQHFRFPVALSAGVWEIIEKAIANKRFTQDLNGIIHDVCFMSKANARKVSETTRLFQVIIRGAGRKSLHTLKIVCGPGDLGEPVLTVMLPSED